MVIVVVFWGMVIGELVTGANVVLLRSCSLLVFALSIMRCCNVVL